MGPMNYDPYVYINKNGDNIRIVAIHVDDLTTFINNELGKNVLKQ